MLDRSLSEVSASWDPLCFEEPDNGIPTQPSLEIGAELEEPGKPLRPMCTCHLNLAIIDS